MEYLEEEQKKIAEEIKKDLDEELVHARQAYLSTKQDALCRAILRLAKAGFEITEISDILTEYYYVDDNHLLETNEVEEA